MKPNGLSLRQALRSLASRLRATPPDIAFPRKQPISYKQQILTRLFSNREDKTEIEFFIDIRVFHKHQARI